MTFPSGTISADDIRNELAYNNTAGAQTPVSLNDGPVRAAADKLSGAVSYNDLRGKTIFCSATIAWGTLTGGYIQLFGYNPNPPGFGGSLGSIYSTTSYYRKAVSTTSYPVPATNFAIYDTYNNYDGSEVTTINLRPDYIGQISPAPSSSYVNVYIDGTKYALTASYYDNTKWEFTGDVLSLDGRQGTTSQVVITY
jgi:hypothetical protein